MRLYRFLACLVLLITGCGVSGVQQSETQVNTSCAPGAARIMVGDGFLRILCGCIGPGEAPGTVFPSPGGLTCHTSQAPSQVAFHFIATLTRHKIISTGPIPFNTPYSYPNDNPPIRAWVTLLETPSTTYPFEDTFSGMTGQIIVP